MSAGFIIAFVYVLQSGKIIKGVFIGWGLFIICTFLITVVFPAVVALYNYDYCRFFPEAIGLPLVILAGWLPASIVSIVAGLARHVTNRLWSYFGQSRTKASIAKVRVFTFIGLSYLFLGILLLGLLYFSTLVQSSSPPDLSSCTRIKIRYPHSPLNYFIPDTELQSILDPEEKKYMHSFQTFEVTDQELIKAFARDVSLGTSFGLGGMMVDDTTLDIACYSNNKHLTSFKVHIYGHLIGAENKRMFKYPQGLPNLKLMEPPQMRAFKLRGDCASNMQRLYKVVYFHRRNATSYPEPTEWCDAIMRDRTNTSYVNEERMRGHFKCPAAGEGKCHYAMNPNCKPDSPPDTVLLFETKAGWNQYGGPELFTFDNHDPKGGCVLLNDGAVKFIRNKEELHQLRWK